MCLCLWCRCFELAQRCRTHPQLTELPPTELRAAFVSHLKCLHAHGKMQHPAACRKALAIFNGEADPLIPVSLSFMVGVNITYVRSRAELHRAVKNLTLMPQLRVTQSPINLLVTNVLHCFFCRLGRGPSSAGEVVSLAHP